MDTGWFFHNAQFSIDSESALPNNVNGMPQTEFATTTFYRLINPVSGWKAFNPNDNLRLATAQNASDPESVPVGYMQMLYHVVDMQRLEPIYWSQAVQPATIYRANWVFACTQTPIAPEWDVEIAGLFQKVKPWSEEYLETVESARATPEILDIVAHRATLAQGSQLLDITILFEPGTDCVAHLFSSARFTPSKKLANELILRKTPKDACQTIVPFDWLKYMKIQKLELAPFQKIGFKPPEITTLILVFHGIGQKLSEKIDSVSFTYAIESLRELIQSLINEKQLSAHLQAGTRFIVLPVNWRKSLCFTDEEDSFPLEEITPPTIPLVRRAITDILMDLPYYMSHHRESILSAAAVEANRLYDLVCKFNPGFEERGSVNLIGHSLGSLIVADILSMQPSECSAPNALLKFDTNCFFTTGSPLAFFLHLQHANIVPRGNLKPEEIPQFGCFAAKSVYNLINHSDVFAFMLNPAVLGNPIRKPRMLEISTGKDRKRLSIFSRCRSPSPTATTTRELYQLNDYGQLDWILPIGPRTFENQYFKIFTAHFDYWRNKEFATFVAIECARKRGPEHAVEEYKVLTSQL